MTTSIILIVICYDISIAQVNIMQIVHLITHGHNIITINITCYLQRYHQACIVLTNRFDQGRLVGHGCHIYIIV